MAAHFAKRNTKFGGGGSGGGAASTFGVVFPLKESSRKVYNYSTTTKTGHSRFFDGALCLKMREPFLSEKSTTFPKFILPKFLENANNATPPRPAFGGATP
ncbi:MAG: hypothetical protein AAB366_00435 [Patescibacteria group bacterium]